MLTLHSAPDSSGTIVRLFATSVEIPLRTRMHKLTGTIPNDVLAMNPTGTLPVLVTPQGPVSETGATLLWLMDAHGLEPGPAHDDRPALLKWLFFVSNTLHADLRQLIWPGRYTAPEGKAGHITLTAGRFLQALAHVEDAARLSPALFTPPGALCFYTLMLSRWATLYSSSPLPWFNLAAFPTLAELAAEAETLPAVKKIARSENLGRKPFSAPETVP